MCKFRVISSNKLFRIKERRKALKVILKRNNKNLFYNNNQFTNKY